MKRETTRIVPLTRMPWGTVGPHSRMGGALSHVLLHCPSHADRRTGRGISKKAIDFKATYSGDSCIHQRVFLPTQVRNLVIGAMLFGLGLFLDLVSGCGIQVPSHAACHKVAVASTVVALTGVPTSPSKNGDTHCAFDQPSPTQALTHRFGYLRAQNAFPSIRVSQKPCPQCPTGRKKPINVLLLDFGQVLECE